MGSWANVWEGYKLCVETFTCKMKTTITAYQVTCNVHLRSNSVHMCLCGAQRGSEEDTCYHIWSDPENERSCFTRIRPTSCTSNILCKLKSLHDCNWKFKIYVLTQKLLFFSRSLSCFPEHFLGKMYANHWKVSPKTHQWKGNKKLPNLKYRNIVVLTFMVCLCVSQITILFFMCRVKHILIVTFVRYKSMWRFISSCSTATMAFL